MPLRILLALVTGLLVVTVDVNANAAGDDAAALQGEWIAISGEVQGQKIADDALYVFQLVIRGNKVTYAGSLESNFELDETSKPKVFSVTPLTGPRKGKTQRAIYSINGDILKVRMSNDPAKSSAQQLQEFATKPGDGTAVVTFKRKSSVRTAQY